MQVKITVARLAQVVMALVFLVSGGVKVWDPVLFYWQSVPYSQLLGVKEQWTLVAQAALLLPPFEIALGLALLANWRTRLTAAAATGLLIFFIVLMVIAWRLGATDSCGCFGALVDRTPGQAAVEDVVMLGLVWLGVWGARQARTWKWAGALVVAGLLGSGAVQAARFAPEAERLSKSDLLPGVALGTLKPKGIEVDLDRGTHIIELFSPLCGRCQHSVPKLNEIHADEGLPSVVGLTSFPQEAPQLVQFRKQLGVRYPIGTISTTDYFRLTWGHGFPRMAHIEDGVVQRVWEYNALPGRHQVLAYFAERAAAAGQEPAAVPEPGD